MAQTGEGAYFRTCALYLVLKYKPHHQSYLLMFSYTNIQKAAALWPGKYRPRFSTIAEQLKGPVVPGTCASSEERKIILKDS